MMDLKFDTKEFEKNLKKISEEKVPLVTEKGLGRAMLQLLNDCIMEIPTVPLREGWLRGSGSVFVQNRFVMSSENMPTAKAKYAVHDYSVQIGVAQFVGVLGFNAPYAARLHEGIGFKFREPSSGPKYIESKLMSNQDVYLEIISNTIKESS